MNSMCRVKVKQMPPAVKKEVKSRKAPGEKVEHGASVYTAFLHIRDLIVHGRLAPGAWVVEGDLCERLEMSRTPVRGALYLLQREGYVIEHRSASKSRMLVAPLTIEDAQELYPIIGRVEGLVGRRAAVLPEKERLAVAKDLKEVNTRLEVIATDRSYHGPEIFELDHEFHRLIVKAGAGPRLTAMHQAIEPQTERYWRLYASAIIGELHVTVDEHKEVIAALIDGDADRLDAALSANWDNGCKRLTSVIDVFGERGSW